MFSNRFSSSSGNRAFSCTRCRRNLTIFGICSINTGQTVVQAPQVVQDQIASSEMVPSVALDDIVEVSPERMSGAPVFRGTRVLVQTLLDYLEAGDSLDAFLADFPTVRRDQAVGFLELAGKAALAPLSAHTPR